MNAMVPGLKGAKMSSSDAGSKVDFLDSPKDVKKKLNQAYCVEGVVEDNGVLAFVKVVLFPIQRLRQESEKLGIQISEREGVSKSLASEDAPSGTMFTILRPEKFGGNLHYSSYQEIEKDYAEKKLHPLDLKNGVADAINILLEPIQRTFKEDAAFQEAETKAYPAEKPVKVVKEKKKGGEKKEKKGEQGTAPADGPAGETTRQSQSTTSNDTFMEAAEAGIQNLQIEEKKQS